MAEDDQLKAVAAALTPKPRQAGALLNERERTHGPYSDNARISQDFKQYIYTKAPRVPQRPEHRESLDMICLKISRILSGEADFKDHWDDIAGYAVLAAKACQNPSP